MDDSSIRYIHVLVQEITVEQRFIMHSMNLPFIFLIRNGIIAEDKNPNISDYLTPILD